MNRVPVPPVAQQDENAVEMISAWIAENGLHVSLNIGTWRARGVSEAGAWGILIADVIRHLGDALQKRYGENAEATVKQVLAALNRELQQPTSRCEGGFPSDYN